MIHLARARAMVPSPADLEGRRTPERRRGVAAHLPPALLAAILAFGALSWAGRADAHFVLQTPPSWWSQDTLGNPQNQAPCGDDGTGTATGTVTTFAAGETIQIRLDEVVTHPGHYRVAIAVNNRSELP